MVKHFPGHGGTSGDSHDGAVSTDKTLEELMAEELVPFQSAIDGGVNFVMVGHISAPNVTGDNAPATLSKVLITDVLRGQMGYNGIVITDAMNMEAVAGFYNSDKAAVLAVTAGADMILMPADYNTAYTGILNAVNDGTITEERINESVTRIVKAKLAMGQP
jgi:beta-glucosidase-related glycosidases